MKHCLKKMLSQRYQSLITEYCENLGLEYKEVVGYWKNKQEVHFGKHVGINRLEKLLRSGDANVEVLKYFMVTYLQFEYMTYLFNSSIENKPAYLDCAIQLIYLAEVTPQQANQLIHNSQSSTANTDS